MSTPSIGKLERVPLRKVWEHEAYDFTQWLQENIDVLNTALDLNLVNVDREQAAGSFSIDLVAEDEGGGTVIIENQLEKSNHDHLGKVITYLTGMGAKAAIWIVSDPRPEHVAAIAWLNESSSASFYMVKIEAVRIGDSAAAALFTLIVGPSEESKNLGQAKKELAERYSVRKHWWTELIERSARVNKLHTHLTPSEYSWIGASSGIRGLNLNYSVSVGQSIAELYIDRGKDADAENKSIFDQLEAHKAQVEGAFGGPLSWDRLDGKRASRIRYILPGGVGSPKEDWPRVQDGIISGMDRLEKALRPYLKLLKLGS
ncbi:MAG: DUF4268 domain-containing protein [Pyrinomonadaceae bacterium]